jgi:hypothetical protein
MMQQEIWQEWGVWDCYCHVLYAVYFLMEALLRGEQLCVCVYVCISHFITHHFSVLAKYCIYFKNWDFVTIPHESNLLTSFSQQHALISYLWHFTNSHNIANFKNIIISVSMICNQWYSKTASLIMKWLWNVYAFWLLHCPVISVSLSLSSSLSILWGTISKLGQITILNYSFII